jgi:hypothetical protein
MVFMAYAVRRSLKANTISTIRRMVPTPMYMTLSLLRPRDPQPPNGGVASALRAPHIGMLKLAINF